MDAKALAHLVRELRKEEGLTLRALAEKMVEEGRYESLSYEMVRRAEDPSQSAGIRITDLRVSIIEALGNRKVRGPIWIYEDEVEQE